MNNNENKPNALKADFSPLYKFCAVLIAIAIVLSAFTYKKVEGLILQLALFTLSGLLMSFGIFLLITAYKAKKLSERNVNYFLYDRKLDGDRNIDTLTFPEIRVKIQKYMGMFKRGKKLYLGDLFDERINIPKAYRPLFCFELLYEMSDDKNPEGRIKMFLSFGVECAGVFYAHLSSAGESQLAEDLKQFFSDFAQGKNNTEEFSLYLKSKKEYIESSVIRYLREHINEF